MVNNWNLLYVRTINFIGVVIIKKIVLFAALFISIFFGWVPNADASKLEKTETFTDVKIHKEWVITLDSKNFSLKNIKVTLSDEQGTKHNVTIKKNEKQLIVTPKKPYAYDTQYTLLVETTKAVKPLRHEITFTTEFKPIENPFTLTRIAEIKAQYDQWKPKYTGKTYIDNPSIKIPYNAGQLSTAVLEDALNTTKLIRFIGGLPTNIKLNENFNKEAQAASLISAINPTLSHYPQQPEKMDSELYKLAYEGASKSNLSKGRNTIPDNILAYMNDGDSSNIDRVGHRLWILSPKLEEVGFGLVTMNTKDWTTSGSAMKVIAENMSKNQSGNYDYISWPAKTAMPTNYFGSSFPWSFSLNAEVFDVKFANEIDITVTRLADQKIWCFNQNKADGYFNISTGNYGYLPYTIIFRPENGISKDDKKQYVDYKHGDQYQVEISNVKKKNGETITITFETTFFTIR